MPTKDILVTFGADTKGIDKAVGKLKKSFSALESTIGGVFAGASLAGIAAYTKSVIDAIGATNRWAEALGIPIEQLSAMGYATQSVGIDTEKLSDQLKDISEKIADAYVNKGGEAVEALEHLNLSAKDLNALNPADQLLAIAGGLANIKSRGAKIQVLESLANDGTLLLPLLEDNAAALRKLIGEAEEFGATIDREMVQRAAQAREEIRQFDAQMSSLGQTLVLELLPAFTTLTGLFNELTVTIKTNTTSLIQWGTHFSLLAAETIADAAGMEEALKKLAILRKEWLGADEDVTDLAPINVIGAYEPPAQSGTRTRSSSTTRSFGKSAEEKQAEEVARLAKEYESLKRAIDPVYDANQRLFESLMLLNDVRDIVPNIDTSKLLEVENVVRRLHEEELEALKDEAEDVEYAWDSAGSSIGDALGDMATGSKKASEALKDLLADIIRLSARYATSNFVASFFTTTPAATGLALPGGSTLGQGVISSPTLFKFAKGGSLGLAGEAGAEAILPLTRTSSGNLGVEAKAASPTININNYAGADISTRQGVNQGDLDIIVRRVSDDIARGGSSIGRSMEYAYGLRRGNA